MSAREWAWGLNISINYMCAYEVTVYELRVSMARLTCFKALGQNLLADILATLCTVYVPCYLQIHWSQQLLLGKTACVLNLK